MKIIELPREGMQSLPFTVPTSQKVELLNLLIRAGFNTVETGSMASPRFVPQMADTLEVLKQLDLSGDRSKLMVLALNKKGAEILSGIEAVDCISYPYAISPVFLKKNLNTTPDESLDVVRAVVDLCRKTNKEAVIYISMAFGNPYGDEWSLELLMNEIEKLKEAGATVIPLSNVSILIDEKRIAEVLSSVIKKFPSIEFGLHLHTDGKDQDKMVDAAFKAGCRRFDTVLHGIGGCPMTGGKMLGNLDTGFLLRYLRRLDFNTGIIKDIFSRASIMAQTIFMPSL